MFQPLEDESDIYHNFIYQLLETEPEISDIQSSEIVGGTCKKINRFNAPETLSK